MRENAQEVPLGKPLSRLMTENALAIPPFCSFQEEELERPNPASPTDGSWTRSMKAGSVEDESNLNEKASETLVFSEPTPSSETIEGSTPIQNRWCFWYTKKTNKTVSLVPREFFSLPSLNPLLRLFLCCFPSGIVRAEHKADLVVLHGAGLLAGVQSSLPAGRLAQLDRSQPLQRRNQADVGGKIKALGISSSGRRVCQVSGSLSSSFSG